MTIGDFRGPIANLPRGTIITWHKSISTIPEGWALCDGNNQTPDLVEKFVKSVPNGSTDPGSVGGSKTVTLGISQIPTHSHSAGSTNDGGEHNHKWGEGVGFDEYRSPSQLTNNGTVWQTSSTNGAHSHTAGSTASQGGGASIDNQPAYEETLFIKRID